jgi:hypothetical protein
VQIQLYQDQRVLKGRKVSRDLRVFKEMLVRKDLLVQTVQCLVLKDRREHKVLKVFKVIPDHKVRLALLVRFQVQRAHRD